VDDWRDWTSADKQRLLQKLKSQQRLRLPISAEEYLEKGLLLPSKMKLAPYQKKMIEAVFKTGRTCIRSPRGAGKTAGAAIAIWGFILRHHIQGHDWKVATTAGSWLQLTRFLWPEIRKWHRFINWDGLGINRGEIEMLTNEIKAKTGTAFAMASSDPHLIEGAHADHLLILIDEAKSVPAKTWDSLEGALGSGDCTVLAISTPGIPAGRFYEIQSQKEGYHDWSVTNIKLQDCIDAKLIKKTWAEQRKKQYGENSAVYKNYVLGEFASSEDGGLIPLDWIEQAIDRYPHKPLSPTMIGLDVAYQGMDKSVAAVAAGEGITEIIEWQGLKESELVGEVLLSAKEVMADYHGHMIREFTVDAIGLGAGVCERLEDEGMNVTRFVGSEKPTGSLGYIEFANRRAEGYWKLRELLNPENPDAIYLPPHDGLKGDLVAITWKPNPQGRVLMEKKDAIKKTLGRSPDYADAVVYAMWGAWDERVGWNDV